MKNESSHVYETSADYIPENPEARILELIETGMKAVELVAELANMRHETILIRCKPPTATRDGEGVASYKVAVRRFSNITPMQLIERMIDEGKIIEIEYVVPVMPYRAKSLYLPAGTQATLITSDKGKRRRKEIL